MLNQIRNSFLCKCLKVLLVGYFLLNSINLSGTFGQIIKNNKELYSVKGITCNFLKKIFKCDGIPEELDDYETKDSKTTKLAKGTLLLEYLISDTALPNLYFPVEPKGKNYIDNPIFSFGFYGKIHLRPPQSLI